MMYKTLLFLYTYKCNDDCEPLILEAVISVVHFGWPVEARYVQPLLGIPSAHFDKTPLGQFDYVQNEFAPESLVVVPYPSREAVNGFLKWRK